MKKTIAGLEREVAELRARDAEWKQADARKAETLCKILGHVKLNYGSVFVEVKDWQTIYDGVRTIIADSVTVEERNSATLRGLHDELKWLRKIVSISMVEEDVENDRHIDGGGAEEIHKLFRR